MKKSVTFLVTIFMLMTLSVLLFGCKSESISVTYSVNGTVTGIDDFSDVSILVNDVPINTKLNSDGAFSISGLKTGDVVSFSKEGYTFNSYTVAKLNAIDVAIVGVLKTFDLVINFDGTLGAVTYQKSCKFYDDVLITFEAFEHAEFLGLYDGETLLTTENSYTYNVQSERELTARFSKILYNITFIKNFADAPSTISDDKMSYGDVVHLTSEDNDDYVFSKYVINGTEITDKVYDYVIDNVAPIIEVVFLERLQKVEMVVNGTVISWADVAHAHAYTLYIDGAKYGECVSPIDLKNYDLYTGEKVVEIIASADGYGSSTSQKTVEYFRPYDTPKNIGIEISSGEVFLVFSRVLASSSYNIYVDDIKYDISAFDYSASGNVVKVHISKIFTENKEYSFAVTATGTLPESDKSNAVTYTYLGALSEPSVTLVDNILAWSHEIAGVTFNISINGVLVQENVTAGSLNILDYLEEEGESVTVVAMLSGYKNSIKNITL